MPDSWEKEVSDILDKILGTQIKAWDKFTILFILAMTIFTLLENLFAANFLDVNFI